MLTRLIACACVVTQLSACYSLAPLPGIDAPGQPLAAGDTIVLVTRNGERRDIVVTSVTPEAVCGAGGCVPRADIADIDRREFDFLKTAALVVLLTGVTALVVAGAQAGAAAAIWAGAH